MNVCIYDWSFLKVYHNFIFILCNSNGFCLQRHLLLCLNFLHFNISEDQFLIFRKDLVLFACCFLVFLAVSGFSLHRYWNLLFMQLELLTYIKCFIFAFMHTDYHIRIHVYFITIDCYVKGNQWCFHVNCQILIVLTFQWHVSVNIASLWLCI